MYLNKIFFAGNLATDPKIYADGTVANLFVIYNHKYKNREGLEVEESVAMPVKAFGYNAKRCAKYKKGDNIFVDGSMVENKYTDKDGKEVISREVKAFSIGYFPREDKAPVASFDNSLSDVPF